MPLTDEQVERIEALADRLEANIAQQRAAIAAIETTIAATLVLTPDQRWIRDLETYCG